MNSVDILVIDDDPPLLRALRRVLSARWQVETLNDAEDALAQAELHAPRLILCDVDMPRLSGPALYERALVALPWAAERMVFLTGDPHAEAVRRTGRPVISKPLEFGELVVRIAALLPPA